MSPLLERIKQAVNERLVHTVDKTLFLDYADPRPENRELHLNIAERGFKGGFLTRNESRALLGYGEAGDGGDEFATPAASPMGLVLEEGMVQKSGSVVYPDEVNQEEETMESRWAKRFSKEKENLVAYLEELA